MERVPVLIADDHAVVREGVRAMLESDAQLEVVGEAPDGAEAVRLASRLRPRVVLMDVRMPVMDGLEATQRIKAMQPNTTIIMLTMYENEAYFIRAIQAGASGYLLKDAPRSEVLGAIHAAASGEALISTDVLRSAVKQLLSPLPNPLPSELDNVQLEPLTVREHQVLQWVAQGMTNKEIGERLGISTETVKKAVQIIIAKMGASDRTHAAVKAVKLGLIS